MEKWCRRQRLQEGSYEQWTNTPVKAERYILYLGIAAEFEIVLRTRRLRHDSQFKKIYQ